MSAEWDERHRRSTQGPPVPLVVEFAGPVPPGRALDLACGTGRNALWLASRGWEVTAVDSSTVAIDLLRDQPRIHAVLADLEKHEFTIEPQAWDLIVVSFYLQRDLFPAIQAGLKPGGLAMIIALMGEGRFRIGPGELRRSFPSLEILHYAEDTEAMLVGRGSASSSRSA